jgi:hypothetical protein
MTKFMIRLSRKIFFNYDAMTLKGLHETVDKVHCLADQHYIDSMETSEDIGAKQEDCKCSAKHRISMKRRIMKYYEALLRGEIADY